MSGTNKPGICRKTPKAQHPPASSLAPQDLSQKGRLIESPWFLGGTFIVTLILWASAFVAIPVALQDADPMAVIMGRLMISSIIFFPLLVRDRAKIRSRFKKDWKQITLMGISGVTVYLLALTYGQRTVGAGQTSLIVNMTPLITGALAALILKEAFHKRMIYGAFISLLGVAFLVLGEGEALSFDPNTLLVLFATVSASYYYILLRRLSKHYSALTLAALTVIIGAIATFPFGLASISGLAGVGVQSGLAILFLGAGSGFLPYIGWAFILSKMPAGKATLYLYFIPVIASLLGWQVLGEVITPDFLFAGALIILGIMTGTGAWKNLRFQEKPRRIVKTTVKTNVTCKEVP